MRTGMRLVRQIVLEQLEQLNQTNHSNNDSNAVDPNLRKKKKRNMKKTKIETNAIASILYLLSSTYEFNDVPPVRHNEDWLNVELCAKLPWGAKPSDQRLHHLHRSSTSNESNESMTINTNTMSDSHTKCYLLLQAHIFHAQLPISDYVMDLRSIMEQVPRLLAAMEFICIRDTVLNKIGDEARNDDDDWSMKSLLSRAKNLLRNE